MKKVILVYTKWCSHCPAAKQLWKSLQKEYKFDYKEVDAESSEGQKIAERFMIMSVPTTIINNKIAFVGMPDKTKAIEAVREDK